MWVRGLKPSSLPSIDNPTLVAPYVGAWIETISFRFTAPCHGVAPYVGAWIETQKKQVKYQKQLMSHPMWVRGLKHRAHITNQQSKVSHPMWVRGLKH